MGAIVQQVIEGRPRDLGDGFMVARILPYASRRMVGPFIFLDQMGPAVHAPGRGLDVRPHPHIGLSTVTYLFEGAIHHRDSTGAVQTIRPGDVNWMTAGSGIVHSERSPDPERAQGQRLFGLQAWVALPAHAEEVAPSFHHHPASTLPSITLDGARRTLIAGSAFGAESPAKVWSRMFYIDVEAQAGASVALPDDHEERAAYIVSGTAELDGTAYQAGQMLVIAPGMTAILHVTTPARIALLGGAPFPEPRHIWWNLVSTRLERIEEAKADWRDQRFPAVPGETEFIPLPEA